MNKKELINYINEGFSHRKIAKEKGISQSTVKYWLNKYNLKTIKPIHKYCELCGNKIKQYNNGNRKRCGSCNTRIRRYRTKKRGVEYLGGKCVRCNWSGNIAAFEFHHIDNNKEFNIGSANNKSWDILKKELNKCELLCSNCHRIEHSKYNEDDNFMNVVNNYKGRNMN